MSVSVCGCLCIYPMSIWQKDYEIFSQAHSKSSALGSEQDCSLIIFRRSSHFTLKGIDFFFLSNLTVFLFVCANHLPVIFPAVRVYLCQSYKQSLQVTVLISALWLPMRFSWGLWEQLVCQCNSQTETRVPWLGMNQICYPSA